MAAQAGPVSPEEVQRPLADADVLAADDGQPHQRLARLGQAREQFVHAGSRLLQSQRHRLPSVSNAAVQFKPTWGRTERRNRRYRALKPDLITAWRPKAISADHAQLLVELFEVHKQKRPDQSRYQDLEPPVDLKEAH